MQIDNSMKDAFNTCPWMYYEKYVRGIEAKYTESEGYSSLDLGGRVHELLEEYYKGVRDGAEQKIYSPSENGSLEQEAQWMLEAYKAHYPADDWEILDVERTFKVELPLSRHIYIGKMDLFIRDRKDGKFYIIDHKTEKRSSKANSPQAWAMKDQGSLYVWAAQKVYNQPVENFIVNMLTRPSEAKRVGPTFPDRQPILRTEAQIKYAIRDLVVVADRIEQFVETFGDREPWPADRSQCYTYKPCEFALIHLYGEDTELIQKHKYQPRSEYLKLDGVEVVRSTGRLR